jgi:hypothetical protein
MDPITAIGAAASITQLLLLRGKSARAAKKLWESFRDAPNELRQLADRLETLKCLIQQIEAAGCHLRAENMDHVLPTTHCATIMASLADQAAQLEQLKSLQEKRYGSSSKLRWALLDKSTASRILKVITDTDQSLNTCLK